MEITRVVLQLFVQTLAVVAAERNFSSPLVLNKKHQKYIDSLQVGADNSYSLKLVEE